MFRKLAELDYRTSYSHRGRYYTLDEIARFDELGLWSFRSVWFSRFGTLVSTVEALVQRAEAGYDAAELEAVLHVEAKAGPARPGPKRAPRPPASWAAATCTSPPTRSMRRGQLAARSVYDAEPSEASGSVQGCACCPTSSRRPSCCSTACSTSASGGSTPGWRR